MKPATQTAAVRECKSLAARAEAAVKSACLAAQTAVSAADLVADERANVHSMLTDAEHYFRRTAANLATVRAFAWLSIIVNAVTLAVLAAVLA